ncbi:hypothetical protein SARC_07260 [Sphaeroforma arctica JP610]|uniref:Helicase C-terminal domain-containing protein n=1 Tax=Sphaeroforma arctica JP610 TaxID=667725 RepID=A0A0L0FUN3_9EUKA|nr:hypothetical protein SARC_07260 [Sphaeroforma arctica JP610]KNC80374.1 hypothetical protein SARC_07260 [Sphaeroforma arctica JP610]|eukprot:XP_014154276.1 hypothetical protein SARC_07260 [Sphaeroforma arctica JP610]
MHNSQRYNCLRRCSRCASDNNAADTTDSSNQGAHDVPDTPELTGIWKQADKQTAKGSDIPWSTKTWEIMSIIQTTPPDEKIVVFCLFTMFFKKVLIPILEDKNIGFQTYIGSMTADQRTAALKEFRDAEGIKVILMSTTAANVGLNLQYACKAIIVDPWWNPAMEMQAENRLWRLKQEKTVTVYQLLIAQSVEQVVQTTKDLKIGYIDMAFSDNIESVSACHFGVREAADSILGSTLAPRSRADDTDRSQSSAVRPGPGIRSQPIPVCRNAKDLIQVHAGC